MAENTPAAAPGAVNFRPAIKKTRVAKRAFSFGNLLGVQSRLVVSRQPCFKSILLRRRVEFSCDRSAKIDTHLVGEQIQGNDCVGHFVGDILKICSGALDTAGSSQVFLQGFRNFPEFTGNFQPAKGGLARKCAYAIVLSGRAEPKIRFPLAFQRT